jgi:hypothetical protein
VQPEPDRYLAGAIHCLLSIKQPIVQSGRPLAAMRVVPRVFVKFTSRLSKVKTPLRDGIFIFSGFQGQTNFDGGNKK